MQFRCVFGCCRPRNHEARNCDDATIDNSVETNILRFEELTKGKPLLSSYVSGNETVTLGEEVQLEHTANGASYRSIPVELRGITLRQLRAVYTLALRLCVEEEWVDWQGNRVTPETMNLYDINKYIIKPFTELTQKSFVESLPSTAGTQPPRWFVSHWWGESFRHTLDCVETFVEDFLLNCSDEDDARGGGMTEDTPIWICAFANNQWALDDDMATDPKKSSFTKAMEVACYRTISILDAGGTVLTRIWCVFELYLTLILVKKVFGLWVIYTAHRHVYEDKDLGDEDRVAVGIIPSGAPSELNCYTAAREKYFPFDLILHSLGKIDIESAQASFLTDKIHILNAVVDSKDIDGTPPTSHPKYVLLNNAVKASFVSSFAVLNAARNAGPDVWKSTLSTLSKGVMSGTFELNFYSFLPHLSSLEAHELVCHLPLTCTGLHIWNAICEYSEGAIEGMVEWVEKAKSLTYLKCDNCYVYDLERARAFGSRLAAALGSKQAESMEELWIRDTDLIDSGNVLDWKLALETMTNLKKLKFNVDDISDEEKIILRDATHASEVEFDW